MRSQRLEVRGQSLEIRNQRLEEPLPLIFLDFLAPNPHFICWKGAGLAPIFPGEEPLPLIFHDLIAPTPDLMFFHVFEGGGPQPLIFFDSSAPGPENNCGGMGWSGLEMSCPQLQRLENTNLKPGDLTSKFEHLKPLKTSKASKPRSLEVSSRTPTRPCPWSKDQGGRIIMLGCCLMLIRYHDIFLILYH